MFNSAKRKEKLKLAIATDQLLTEMISSDMDSPNYSEALDRLERVNKIRKTSSPMRGVSPDTIVTTAGSLLGVLVIVAYEQKHVWVSAAAKHLPKAF